MISDKIIRFHLFDDYVSPHYIALCLNTGYSKIFIESKKSGMADSQVNISQDNLKLTPIPISSYSIQKKVIDKVKEILGIIENLERQINNNKQDVEMLLQAVLKEAFESKPAIQKESKQNRTIPFPAPADANKEHQRKVLAGYIVAMCYQDDHFGITKFQKTLHVVEYHCQLEFNMHYRPMTAGPMDEFIYAFIEEGQEKDWLRQYNRNGFKYYELGNNMSELTVDFAKYFKPYITKLRFIWGLLNGKTTREAELMSTVYAVWNNLLIQGRPFTDKDLTTGVYNWSEQKEKFTEPEILAMRNVMKREGLVPVGFGKEITKE